MPVPDDARQDSLPPKIVVSRSGGAATVTLVGHWTLRGVAHHSEKLIRDLRKLTSDPDLHWNLSTIAALDTVGAFVLWTAAGGQRPQHIEVRAEHIPLFRRWTDRQGAEEPPAVEQHPDPFEGMGRFGSRIVHHLQDLLSLLGQFVLDCIELIRRPSFIPWRDISATIYQTGIQALGIVALVGFLTGVVVSYLSSLELKSYGAGNFIVVVVGVGILRELGPILTAVLLAGRSGSAMAAQLGVMRVTQELDALSAMGISHTQRLVLPKIVALTIVMPLMVAWSNLIAMLGAMLAARVTLGFEMGRFLETFPKVVPVANLWFGLGKGVVFGALVALIACHYGLRIKPNTESLGRETTSAVVTAITLTILMDALFAIVFRNIGLP